MEWPLKKLFCVINRSFNLNSSEIACPRHMVGHNGTARDEGNHDNKNKKGGIKN